MEENNIEKNEKIGGKSIASFVLGLVGIIAWILPLIGYPVTITGLILGCIARKNEKNAFSLTGKLCPFCTKMCKLYNLVVRIKMLKLRNP